MLKVISSQGITCQSSAHTNLGIAIKFCCRCVGVRMNCIVSLVEEVLIEHLQSGSVMNGIHNICQITVALIYQSNDLDCQPCQCKFMSVVFVVLVVCERLHYI